MAVVIPLIAGAIAGAAGATAIVATAISIGAGLVANATGISAKVDKAAGKVFGRDFVKAFNIIGAVYGAAGGFAGAGPSEVWGNISGAFGGGATAATTATEGAVEAGVGGATDASSVNAVNGADLASDLVASTEAVNAGVAGPGAMGGDIGGQSLLGPTNQAPAAPSWAQPTPPVAGPQAAQSAVPTGSAGVSTANETAIGKIWSSLGDKGQAALIQVGGQMLAGVAQGKATEAEMKAAEERDRKYRSGSGRPWSPSTQGGALAAYNSFYARPAGG